MVAWVATKEAMVSRQRRKTTPGSPQQLIGPGTDPSTCIAVGGELFDIGIPVLKWFEEGGFDGYTTERVVHSTYNERADRWDERVVRGRRYGKRRGGPKAIDQIVLHHTGGDGDGAARVYNTLFRDRRLSVHFVVDDDGRVFQFLDVMEKAWHAGKANRQSVGIECNLFPLVDAKPNYYSERRNDRTNNVPHDTATFVVHGRTFNSFVMPDVQVDSACRLSAGIWAALHRATGLPRFEVAPLFPHDEGGQIPRTNIDAPQEHEGLIAHFHLTPRKIDPLGIDLDAFEHDVAKMHNLAADDAACEQRS